MITLSKMTKEKQQLWIYVIVAFGVPYLLGLLMWYGYATGKEMSVFANAQMFFPAAGVMLAYMLTRKKDNLMPRRFFVLYLIIALVMVVSDVLCIIVGGTIANLVCQFTIIGGSVLSWILILTDKKERRLAYGLRWKSGKASVLCILLFVVLYLLKVAAAYAVAGEAGMMGEILTSSKTWSWMLFLIPNFFLAFLAFFGEEYGWRFYLQPFLQRRFGKKAGVLILGFVWGIWHLPLNCFFYSPDAPLISLANQEITCIALGIFFAYAYMKTGNFWVPVILHFLNNNLVPIITGAYSADVIQNQTLRWSDLPLALLLNAILFCGFIFTKEFRKEKNDSPAIGIALPEATLEE